MNLSSCCKKSKVYEQSFALIHSSSVVLIPKATALFLFTCFSISILKTVTLQNSRIAGYRKIYLFRKKNNTETL